MQENRAEFRKKLMQLTVPMAFQSFMVSLVGASDAIMVGSLSQSALSAVSLGTQVAFVESLFLEAVTIGLSMFAAQYWGAKDRDSFERIYAYTLRLALVCGVLFFSAGLFFSETLMRIFTPDAELIRLGSRYLRTVSLSYLLTGVTQILMCVLKNSGRAAKASLISCSSVLLNIALNALLIFGLLGFSRLEIAGAAAATVFARIFELIFCIVELKKRDTVKLRIGYLLHDTRSIVRPFWKYVTPVMANEAVWGIGFTMYSVIMGHLGSDAVAANSIANVVKNLTFCFCSGLAGGGAIMVGNELGAGNLDVAKAYGARLVKLSILFGAAAGLLIVVMTQFIVQFANLSPQASHYLRWMLVMTCYYMVGRAVNSTTIAGIFCAGGDSRFGLYCDAVTMWCICVPLGLLAAFVFKLPVLAVYFIVNMDEMVKLPAVWFNYRKYKWVRNLTIKEE